MAVIIPTQAAAGSDCRTAIQNAIDAASDGDTIRLTNQTSATWIVSGRADPNGTGGDKDTLGGGGPGALGAIEFTKGCKLALDPAIILQESATSPITELNQPFLRWLNKSGVGITFGAGSKILGQRAVHAEASEFMAGAKIIGCTGVTISGTNQVHFDGFYGDGLWFASGGYPVLGPLGPSTGVAVRNIQASNNYRNGITVESCVGTFQNIGGTGNIRTSPQAFMDIETDIGTEAFSYVPTPGIPDTIQVTVDGGGCEGRSHGIAVIIANSLVDPILVTLKNFSSVRSTVAGDDPWGFDFTCVASTMPSGSRILCQNLRAVGLKSAGYRFNWPLNKTAELILQQCVAENCSTLNLDKPFDFNLSQAPTGFGIRLNDCLCIDKDFDRVAATVVSSGGAATNVRGNIRTQRFSQQQDETSLSALLPSLQFQRLGGRTKRTTRVSSLRGTQP